MIFICCKKRIFVVIYNCINIYVKEMNFKMNIILHEPEIPQNTGNIGSCKIMLQQVILVELVLQQVLRYT